MHKQFPSLILVLIISVSLTLLALSRLISACVYFLKAYFSGALLPFDS